MMNIGKLLYKSQSSIRTLITNTPAYSSAIDVSGEGLSLTFRRWATKKTAGSTKNERDSLPKKSWSQKIWWRESDTWEVGTSSFVKGEHASIVEIMLESAKITLYALKEGCVKFERHKLSGRKWVHVEPKDGHEIHPVYASADARPEMKTAA